MTDDERRVLMIVSYDTVLLVEPGTRRAAAGAEIHWYSKDDVP